MVASLSRAGCEISPKKVRLESRCSWFRSCTGVVEAEVVIRSTFILPELLVTEARRSPRCLYNRQPTDALTGMFLSQGQ